jgi:hypothetical protein
LPRWLAAVALTAGACAAEEEPDRTDAGSASSGPGSTAAGSTSDTDGGDPGSSSAGGTGGSSSGSGTTSGGTPTGGTTGATTTSGATGTSGGEPDSCGASSQCFPNEVCFLGRCNDPWMLDYELNTEFSPATCDDGFSYPIDPFYILTVNSLELPRTDYVSGCGFIEWPDRPTIAGTDVVRWDFWDDEDPFAHEFLAAFCWQEGATGCSPIPREVLHDGGWEGEIGATGHLVRLTLTPLRFTP